MSDLETILRKFSKKDAIEVFDDDGKFTKEGYAVYCDFCQMLHDLSTIVDFNADEIETELDKIVEFEN